jgi:serine/threonine protein phosphatase 1
MNGVELVSRDMFIWYRDMIKEAYIRKDIKNAVADDRWSEIYLGHTPVSNFNKYLKTPQKWTNIWAMDTSATFKGCVTLMDIDSKEIYQSDECFKLYANEAGRNDHSYEWYVKNNISPYSGMLTYTL